MRLVSLPITIRINRFHGWIEPVQIPTSNSLNGSPSLSPELRAVKVLATLLILLSLAANPFTLERVLTPDGYISAPGTVFEILLTEAAILLCGLAAYRHPVGVIRIVTDNALIRLISVSYSQCLYAVCFSTASLATLLAGGLIVLAYQDQQVYPPLSRFSTISTNHISLLMTTAGMAVVCAVYLFRRSRRAFLFSSILYLGVTTVTLFLCEITTSFFVPPWPARGLHGVSPELGPLFSERYVDEEDKIRCNSWGQRDRERTINPHPLVHRIAFVGDSFLECSPVPVSLRVEEMIDRADVEVLNLGVSATAPDEYYYRIRNIAIPLGIKHCYYFFFTGNDFISNPTLQSRFGIMATYPRDSLLTTLGLHSLNHVLMNNNRPIFAAWRSSSQSDLMNGHLQDTVSLADDADAIEALLSLVPDSSRHTVAGELAQKDLSGFLDMLRNPDGGLFGSRFLTMALKAAGGEWKTKQPEPQRLAYHWLARAKAACDDHGVGFTVVTIPASFQVDPRVQQQWQPLVDMKRLTTHMKEGNDILIERLRAEGIDYIDLHPVLDGQAGAYFNLDGHWARHGVDLVSAALIIHVQRVCDNHN